MRRRVVGMGSQLCIVDVPRMSRARAERVRPSHCLFITARWQFHDVGCAPSGCVSAPQNYFHTSEMRKRLHPHFRAAAFHSVNGEEHRIVCIRVPVSSAVTNVVPWHCARVRKQPLVMCLCTIIKQQAGHDCSRTACLGQQLVSGALWKLTATVCLHWLPCQLPNVLAWQASSISLLAAWRIPGVASFAATLFFCKLVAYTFLYWLPFYLSTTEIGGRRLSPQARARGPRAAPPCCEWLAPCHAPAPALALAAGRSRRPSRRAGNDILSPVASARQASCKASLPWAARTHWR